jgi:3-keto steroid reductase
VTKTDHSYESVKYQIELIATTLDRIALRDSSSPKSIRHFVSHPGVASTKISTNLVAFGGFLDTLKVWVFYVVRRRFFFVFLLQDLNNLRAEFCLVRVTIR